MHSNLYFFEVVHSEDPALSISKKQILFFKITLVSET